MKHHHCLMLLQELHEYDSAISIHKTAWSFAIFNIEPASFTHANAPFAQALLSRDPSSFNGQDFGQLHQFQLWCLELVGFQTS
jgi:hypothetical protein